MSSRRCPECGNVLFNDKCICGYQHIETLTFNDIPKEEIKLEIKIYGEEEINKIEEELQDTIEIPKISELRQISESEIIKDKDLNNSIVFDVEEIKIDDTIDTISMQPLRVRIAKKAKTKKSFLKNLFCKS